MSNLYCEFIEINDKWVCGKCGAVVHKNNVPNKPFSVCGLVINNKEIVAHVLKKRGTPFGITDQTLAPHKYIETGPGTELKKLLSLIGIKATTNCTCNKKAQQMNKWGPDKCQENMNIILRWLKEEADKRKLFFVETIARWLVKRAIKNSRNQG